MLLQKTLNQLLLNYNDLIIDTLIDHENNVIPLVLEVTKVKASTVGKHIVSKYADLAPARFSLEDSLMKIIKDYIKSVQMEIKA